MKWIGKHDGVTDFRWFKDMFFHIGSFIITDSETFYPPEVLGGTWEHVEDLVLRGSGLYRSKQVVGSDEITLTEDNLPSHTHGFQGLVIRNKDRRYISFDYGTSGVSVVTTSREDEGIVLKTEFAGGINATGKGKAFEAIPHSRVTHMWVRTA